MPRSFTVHIPLLCALLGLSYAGCGHAGEPADATEQKTEVASGNKAGETAVPAGLPEDTIAMVGDQPVTFNQIDIMLNSSAVIGMTIPPPGTPERNQVRLTLLDRIVSANLIYLDALDKGLDDNPVYQHDVERFIDSNLTTMYRKKHLIGDIQVSEEEIDEYYKNSIVEGTPFTKDLGTAIEASLRKKKHTARMADLRQRLREGVQISIDEAQLDPEQDGERGEGAVLAKVDQEEITWGEARAVLSMPRIAASVDKRRETLNQLIDDRIMLKKARATGLEQDPKFQERLGEFRKVRLINMHRNELVAEMEPTDDEVRAYYQEHRDTIMVPESRRIQMIVMAVKEDAEKVKQQIEAGEITIFEAAKEYSIDPNAKKTLGEMGWVEKGTGFPELDELAFSLSQDQLGGPVQSPAGWHLLKVLEIRPATMTDISQADAWRISERSLVKERLDGYTADLRRNKYPVVLYDQVLNRLLEEELQPAAEPAGGEQEAS